jgi:regulator of cell morphogenesis and NO signaling
MATYHLINFYELPLDELCVYITEKHHAFTKQILPVINERLNNLIMKESDENSQRWIRVSDCFNKLNEEMIQHMRKEETVLFPFAHKMQLAANGEGDKDFPRITMVKNPVELMNKEHNKVSQLLKEIRELTNNYAGHVDDSTQCRVCLAEMFELDQDLQKHFYLEERVLYNGMIKLEQTLISQPQNEPNRKVS